VSENEDVGKHLELTVRKMEYTQLSSSEHYITRNSISTKIVLVLLNDEIKGATVGWECN
jgi:hypothetical protein